MKKTTKKMPSKPKGAKATKNLEVKPVNGAAVRGGGWSQVGNRKY